MSLLGASQEVTEEGRQGLRPWIPRRAAAHCSRLRWKAALSKAALKGFMRCDAPVLFGTASKTGFSGGSMPDFG